MDKKDAYVEKMKAKVDIFKSDIDKLAAKAKEAKADARIRYLDQIEELKRQRRDADDKLEAIKETASDTWEDVRSGFENAYDNLKDSIERLKAKMEG